LRTRDDFHAALRDGAMAYWRDTSVCERLTRHHSDQPSHLHADWTGIGRPYHTTASHCYMMNIDFPFHFDGRGRTAETDDDDHIRDMIEELLFTNPGERVNRPDFGSGLLQMVFAPNSPELATALQFTLQAALQRWLGDLIDVQKLEVTSEEATLRIEIVYVVRRTQQQQTAQFARPV
jgi:uncharacterized protein